MRIQGRWLARAMSVPVKAAPKPLSMLTTVTLGEQELSMPRRAAAPAKDGSVADRGGHGDDGNGDEAADDRGQGAFHAGADDDARWRRRAGIAHGQEAMEAGDADIVEAGDLCAEEFRGDGGLFGHGEVAGAGAEDGDVTRGFGRGRLPESEGAGLGVVRDGGKLCEDGPGGLGGAARGEDVGAGGSHAG